MKAATKDAVAPNNPHRQKKAVNLDTILRRLIPFICIGVLGNLTYSLVTTDSKNFHLVSNFSWPWLGIAMTLALLPWLFHSLRLAVWSRFFGVKIARKNLLKIAIATDLGGAVAPTALGGAPLKLALLLQHGFSPGQATTLTLWGNIEDILFYVFAIPLSLILTKNWENPLFSNLHNFLIENKNIAIILSFSLIIILLIINRLFKKKHGLEGIYRRLKTTLLECKAAFQLILSKGQKSFFQSFLFLVAQWLTRFCILLAVVKLLGLEADFYKLLLVQWMVFVAILITPTPGGTGGAEAGFLLVFASSLPIGTAGVVMAVWRLLTYYFIMIIGALILMFSNQKL
ncbi:MAG: flippase-like domain-containing protein [Bacteroidetes bacterium]|nr:flippase-like domain-containing protein [Bacteroidota bacterium]